MGNIILVTGGARSGKSSFALKLAENVGTRRLFVATCPNLDEEMNDRVDRHKREREGRGWDTAEIETDLQSLFPVIAADYEVVLIDCITLWVNNLLYEAEKNGNLLADAEVRQECDTWLTPIKNFDGTVICVTNEVGLGIVPDNKTARLYRDLVGTCNQTIGRVAEEVVLVSCGVPLYIKNRNL